MPDPLPVLVVVKDHHLPATPVYDMVESVKGHDSQPSGHGWISFPSGVLEKSKNMAKLITG